MAGLKKATDLVIPEIIPTSGVISFPSGPTAFFTLNKAKMVVAAKKRLASAK
jgi:hypothetical protein